MHIARTMTVITVVMLMATAAHAAWHGPMTQPTLNGVLVEVTGPVTTTAPKGNALPAVIGTELAAGSRITTSAGASASVMLMDGAVIAVPEKSTYIVGTPPPRKDKATLLRGITIALNEAQHISLPPAATANGASAPAAAASPRVHGMVKMGQVGPGAAKPHSLPFGQPKAPQAAPAAQARGFIGIYPVETAIVLPKTLTFSWSPQAAFSNAIVIVEGADLAPAATVAVAPKSTETRATMDDVELHEGKTYTWYLASRGDKPGRGRSRRFSFEVLSAEKRASLDRDLARIDETAETADGRSFLKAQLYFNYGMNYEMVQTLLPLWKTNKSPAIKKLLKLGYARMGRIDEARKYK